jgi:hypothetical protein
MSDTSESREAVLVILERDYSTLDSALIRSMALDLDPLNHIVELRQQLSMLSFETQHDDYDGTFDPSGMGASLANNTSHEQSNPFSTPSKNTSQESEPITRSTSSSGSSFTEDSEQYREVIASMVYLDNDEKIQNLLDFFPKEPLARIEFLLKKHHWDFTKVLDTLLSETFMASDNPTKGVDGFLEERVFISKKKNKKGRGRKNSGDSEQIAISAAVYKKIDAEIDTVPVKSGKNDQATRTPNKSFSQTPEVASDARYTNSSDASSAWVEYTRKGNAASRNPNLGRFAGAAASVYHSEANSLRQTYNHLSKGESDRLVASTATKTQIDLHGVTVVNAVRIALARTNKWWDELDDRRKYTAHLRSQNQFRIITGVGNHSVGGVGKLGPAVFKQLTANGWKASLGTGVIIVNGRYTKK